MNDTPEPVPVSEEMKPLVDRLKRMQDNPRLALENEERERRKASQRRQSFIESLAAQVGQRFSPARCSLDSYRVYNDAQGKVIKALRDLLPNLAAFVADGRGILWLGTVGTGKDHLAAALMYVLAREQVSCSWIRGLDLYGRLRDRMDADKAASEESLLRELAAPQVLCISDPIPGVGDLSAWRTEFLQRLVDRRYNAMKSTWATLNARTPADADAALSSQVFDRLRHDSLIFRCEWPSYREAGKL